MRFVVPVQLFVRPYTVQPQTTAVLPACKRFTASEDLAARTLCSGCGDQIVKIACRLVLFPARVRIGQYDSPSHSTVVALPYNEKPVVFSGFLIILSGDNLPVHLPVPLVDSALFHPLDAGINQPKDGFHILRLCQLKGKTLLLHSVHTPPFRSCC